VSSVSLAVQPACRDTDIEVGDVPRQGLRNMKQMNVDRTPFIGSGAGFVATMDTVMTRLETTSQ
jgi:hypothetical protein